MISEDIGGFDGLDETQINELDECAKANRANAVESKSDKLVKQFVISKFNYHWIFIYYRTVDDIVDDTWSVTITRINHLIIEKVMENTPYCTNLHPLVIADEEGNFWLNDDDDDDEGEEEDV